jgi:hypothetical protein
MSAHLLMDGPVLRQLPNDGVFLYETKARFSDIAKNQFALRIPGGTAVICKCADRTRTVILDRTGWIETVY